MRPIKLDITAFGPFKDSITIDFSLLGEEGLYLISGATGSGKTTVFDALSYALFGVTTAEEYRDAADMRSDLASPDVPTSVELIFSEKGEKYTIKRSPAQSRPKKRGDGMIDAPASAELYLPDGSIITKMDQATRKIEEIIGITAGQFAQIVMLAQGKFSRFLVSKTDEKRELFKKIFNTDCYGTLQSLLAEKAKEAKDAYSAINMGQRTILSGIEVSDESQWHDRLENAKNCVIPPVDAEEILEGVKSEAEKASEKSSAALEECRRKESECGKAIAKSEEKERLNADLAEKENLHHEALSKLQEAESEAAGLPEHNKKREALLSKISDLNNTLPKYDEKELLLSEIRDRKSEMNNQKRKAESASSEINNKKKEIQKAEEESEKLIGVQAELDAENEKYRGILKQLRSYEDVFNAIDRYKDESEKRKREEDSLSEISKDIDELDAEKSVLLEKKASDEEKLEALKGTELQAVALNTLYETVRHLSGAYSERGEKKKEEKAALDKMTECAGILKKKIERRSEIISSYYLSEAAMLAEHLEEGKPCPVCGSLSHPHPAVSDGLAYTRNDIEAAEKAEREASDNVRSAEIEKNRISDSINMLSESIEKYRSSLPENLRSMEIHEILSSVDEQIEANEKDAEMRSELTARLAETDERLSSISDRIIFLDREKSASKASLKHYADSIQALQTELEEKTAALGIQLSGVYECHERLKEEETASEGRIEVLKKDNEKALYLSQRIKELRDRIDAIKSDKARLDAAVLVLDKEISIKVEREKVLSEKLEYKERQSAEEKLKSLLDDRAQIEALISGISVKLNVAKGEKAYLEGIISEIRKQVSAIPDYDIEKLKAEAEAIGEQKADIERRKAECDAELRSISKAIIRYRANEEKARALRERWAMLQELSDVANGTLSGEDRLSLETYVQTRYLDRILKRANVKLLNMSDYQYEMERSTEARSKGKKMGLDINIMDHFSCKQRPASTLSGGETFKASLALALGLSEEIQANTGAVRIETMFVDEGFGTLDEDSLLTAVSVLSTLADGGRLVGVISHVGELKNKISKQILVEKGKSEGSTVRINL